MFRIRIHFFRIRIQRLRLETDPDPIRIQGFNDQKLKKNYSWKKNLLFFWSKTAIYLSLGLHKVCPSYRRSLQLSKEAIQHFKFFSTFVGHFCSPGSGSGFRIRIRIHWPDWIRIQSGSGSETLSIFQIKCMPESKLAFSAASVFIQYSMLNILFVFCSVLFQFLTKSRNLCSTVPYLLHHCLTVGVWYGIGTERCSKEMIPTLYR